MGRRKRQACALAWAITVESQELQTLAGQDHLYDVATLDTWIAATLRGEHALAAEFERRFRPEFAVAYLAGLKTDPFHDPKAPPGPGFLPEYRSAHRERACELAREARGDFDRGVATGRLATTPSASP